MGLIYAVLFKSCLFSALVLNFNVLNGWKKFRNLIIYIKNKNDLNFAFMGMGRLKDRKKVIF